METRGLKSEVNPSEELPYNVLDVICRVGKKLENSKLTHRALQSVQHDTLRIAEYLGVTELQAALFCVVFVINYDHDNSVDLRDLGRYLDLVATSTLRYYKELQVFADKSIFVTEEYRRSKITSEEMNFAFCVEETVCEAIMKNIRIKELPAKEEKTIFGLLNFVGDNFFDKDSDGRVSNFRIVRDFERKENEYLSIPVVGKLKELLYPNDRILFYDFCYDKLCNKDDGDSDLIWALRDLYGEFELKKHVDEFKKENHHLQKLGFVELVKDDMIKRPSVKVTDKGLEMLLGEEAELYIETVSDKDLIAPEEITAKELFYSEETGNQIGLLRSSLQNKKFRELQARLSKEKMPKGICALFYGYPGTGKTESVYQIAKATKRRIYHVDISQTKSCWFGESEKIIKEVFEKYKSFCKKCRDKKENAPILLFNEADAVFAKRKDSNSSNVAQTENAIQNIILEQMENLDGIMIATTNLENNFDSAFERRFLFKIKFEKPTIENRAKIWQNKIASLSQNDAIYLAENYDFSGGEIDNIVRKSLMQNIISGDERSLQSIEELCKTEKLNSENTRAIGFRGVGEYVYKKNKNN